MSRPPLSPVARKIRQDYLDDLTAALDGEWRRAGDIAKRSGRSLSIAAVLLPNLVRNRIAETKLGGNPLSENTQQRPPVYRRTGFVASEVVVKHH